jgi:hypothetical protein
MLEKKERMSMVSKMFDSIYFVLLRNFYIKLSQKIQNFTQNFFSRNLQIHQAKIAKFFNFLGSILIQLWAPQVSADRVRTAFPLGRPLKHTVIF